MMHLDDRYGTASGLCVHRAGSEVTEPPGFTIDRPAGTDDYDFLHFNTPVTVLAGGRRTAVRPGACLMYSPGAAQWYSGGERSFTHDWFHFYGPSADSLVKACGIPVNRIFYPPKNGIVTDTVRAICLEIIQKQACWEYAVHGMVTDLLVRLRRGMQESATAANPAKKALANHRINDVRVTVHARPEQHWTIDEMARRACLGRARFSLLYKKMFEISPIEDVIRARLVKARWLIENSTLTVRQIGRQVGFEDPAYFSRVFVKRMGVTPGRYFAGRPETQGESS